MLGSGWVVLAVEERGKRTRLLFTGDWGREALPLLRSPEVVSDVDVLLIESPYGDRQHPDIADTYNHLHEYHLFENNTDLAIEFCHKSLNINIAIFEKSHPNIAMNHAGLGNCHTLQAQYTQALQHYQLALQANYDDFNSNDLYAENYGKLGINLIWCLKFL